MAKSISFARGAPSLDIVDVDGLKEAAQSAFTNDPGRVTAYGSVIDMTTQDPTYVPAQ